jgi:KaiC/GvpD/RAD55 family RecA-like ATPase
MTLPRQTFGLNILDRHLGGGLIPGTLTVIAGATGAGKTQLGLRWADRGLAEDGRRGVLCDLTSRGDSQNHAGYARQHFGWELSAYPSAPAPALDLERIWDAAYHPGDYYHPFARSGRRVTRRDLEPDAWHEWKSELARILRHSVAFFYEHFVRGTRRVVVDGIEPSERFAESIQFEFFEYLYHQILRKEDEWAARELFREHYRAQADRVLARRYDHRAIGCLYLYTTPHVFLEDLIAQPIGEGDIFSNANTIILMGRTRQEGRVGRALYVAKHRGSACGDEILTYSINQQGIDFDTTGGAGP